jgi:molybdopterin/thiamine biosynthesis adenylyltransferase/rhodanese-related sulfurtransferase
MLSQAELARYQRQILLPELGIVGQERLKRSRVLVIGAGGLGSPVALYLAGAGVGTLGIVDSDVVEPSNLHRQILHGSSDVGGRKVDSAAAAIRELNPDVVVQAHALRIDTGNARMLIADYDVVVDGSDNFAARYAVNDACAALGRPWVYGSVERYTGQVSVFGTDGGPCYRCIFPEPPATGTAPACDEIGVLGAIPGIVGSWQAIEAIKLLAGIGTPLSGRMAQLDLLRGDVRWIRFERRPDCAACGTQRAKDSNMQKPEDLPPFNIDPEEVNPRLAAGGARLIDVREPWEVQRASIAGATTMPMRTVQEGASTLDRTEELIVFCHHGSRSRAVTDWLRSQGFRARNLNGGIDRWSSEVDPSVPRY